MNTKLNLNSLFFGAYAATAVLTVYTMIGLVSSVFVTAAPYVAGVALFITLGTVFLSIIGMLRKMRKGARKTFAVVDTYAALAVLTVLGYFIAACVQTFTPGGDPLSYWSNGAVAAISWAALFACGKYGAELFRAGNKG